MSRGQQSFRQTDLAKALRAAKHEGVAVRIEITPGKMVVISGRQEQDADDDRHEPGEWD